MGSQSGALGDIYSDTRMFAHARTSRANVVDVFRLPLLFGSCVYRPSCSSIELCASAALNFAMRIVVLDSSSLRTTTDCSGTLQSPYARCRILVNVDAFIILYIIL